MIDNDIIKALRHCNGGDCETCKALGACDATWKFHQHALDLINRQKAEIERCKGVIKLLEKDVADAKSEVVKEFAERLKAEYVDFDELHEEIRYDNLMFAIDDLVKEMTEGKE